MSDYEHKDMSGNLFKNEKKEKETQPDYNGGCKINGEVYQISAWINKSQNTGKTYFNFKFQSKEEVDKYKGSKKPITPETDDDLPF
tara:strand:+ start:5834 stop:6091 length:258 start_codon:yes stop_codon:yes gene_type:complete